MRPDARFVAPRGIFTNILGLVGVPTRAIAYAIALFGVFQEAFAAISNAVHAYEFPSLHESVRCQLPTSRLMTEIA
jgi:hypothetical protein